MYNPTFGVNVIASRKFETQIDLFELGFWSLFTLQRFPFVDSLTVCDKLARSKCTMIGRLERESSNNISKNRPRNGAHDKSCSGDQGVIERRVLRSRYLAVKTFIDGIFLVLVPGCFKLSFSVSDKIRFLLFVYFTWLLLADDGEDLSRADSEKFKFIINEVEILHQLGIHALYDCSF